MRISNLAVVAFPGLLLVGACGLTTQSVPNVPQPNLPPPILVNNVPKPDDTQFSIGSYCGNLAVKNQDGSFETLLIPAYTSGTAPQIVAPQSNSPPSYHSLLDGTMSASLSAAYAVATAGFTVTGQDRLEVVQKTVAYCNAPSVDKDVIRAAVRQLDVLRVDRDRVYIIAGIVHNQMTVDILKAISSSAQGAATPIVNFGGQNFSKSSQTRISNFISLRILPIQAAAEAPVGTLVPASAPPAALASSTPASAGTPSASPMFGRFNTVRASPEQFAAGLRSLENNGITIVSSRRP